MVEADRGDRERVATTTNAALRGDRRNGMLYRLWRQMLPHYVLAGVWLAGVVGHAAGRGLGDPGRVVALLWLGWAAAVTLGWMRRRRVGRVTTLRLALGWVAAFGWLWWVVYGGVTWSAVAVLVCAGYGASLRWWRRWRIPNPPPDPPPPSPEDPNHPPRLWAANLAGRFCGSYLSDEQPILDGHRNEIGLRYACHLRPGEHTRSDLLAALPKLRSGLRLRPRQDLVIERHPRLDESVVQVTIVRRSPALERPPIWPGPSYDPASGTIAVGPYVDGQGVAAWLLYRDHGLFGGFLAGVTGSGKSRMIDSIAMSAAAAGIVIWYADPRGGSSPLLARYADNVAVGLDAIASMLEQAMAVKQLREAQNTVHRWEGWWPAQHTGSGQPRPGLLVFIDECHDVFGHQRLQKMAEKVAREGRKLGIAIICASQVATLDAFGLKSGDAAEALRSSVCAGNMVFLRTTTKNSKDILPGVDVDPAEFPATPGYAYLVDQRRERRCAPLRGYHLDAEHRDEIAEQVTWPTLDTASANAAGGPYLQRHQRDEQARADLAGWVARVEQGLAAGEMPGGGQPETPAEEPGQAGPQVIQLPTWPPEQHAGQPGRPARRTAVDVVAELVAGGLTRTGEIIEASGYRKTQVHDALRALEAAGRIHAAGHGRWQANPATPTRNHHGAAPLV